MKKYLILFLGMVIFFMGVKANDKNFVTKEDVYFERDVVYKKDTNKPFTGTVIFKDENGKIREEIDFKVGIREGEYIEYYKNGEIKTFVIFKNGKRNGVCKTYSKDGQLRLEFTYRAGLLNGPYIEYYEENKKIKTKGEYKSTSVFNVRDSKVRKDYYLNGKLKRVRTYEETDEGENFFEKNYHEKSGKLTGEGKYINNQRDGIFKVYYENGNIYGEYGYKNGSDNGKFKEYYENGNLKKEGSIENGQINGLAKYYYETGELYLEKIWRYGEAIEQREYDKNGALLSEYTY